MKQILLILGMVVFFGHQSMAQTVTGKVTDGSTNEVLPGVNIVVKGTTIGTSSDADGTFEINVPSLRDTLTFSFIGYKTLEIPINGRTTIEASLQSQAIEGEEMVVIGYGTARKSDVTGSVSSVSIDELNQSVSTSVDQMLSGKISGVNVVRNSGEPGGGISINIRGSGSINASNSPLYVVDGIPMNNERPISGSGLDVGYTRTSRNPLSSLNPGDIESVEILKDASATAIYGARGANGVVLITTKSGLNNQVQVEYHGSVGIQNWSNKLDLLNAEQYQRELNAIIEAGGEDPSYRVGEIQHSTDWQDEIANKNAPVLNNQLSISGGSENTTYYMSLNYMNQEGTIQKSAFTRYSGRLNIESQISEKINVGFKVTGSYSKDDFIPNGGAVIEDAGVVATAFNYDPTFPVKNPDGSFALNELFTLDNPMALLEGVDSESNTNRTFASAFSEFDITSNLNARVSVGGDFTNEDRKSFMSDITKIGRQNNGVGSNQNSEMSHVLLEGTLNYNKTYDIHDFNAVGGITFERFVTNYHMYGSSNFPSQGLGAENLGLGNRSNFELSNFKTANRLASYLGRVNYTLSDKYLFTLSGRLDGSSRFGENNKFAFFPSGAIGWNLSEESFTDGLEDVNNLKLRASWGRTGNQEIGDYPFARTFSEGATAVIDDQAVTTTSPTRMPNPDLKWETTKQINFGLDYGLWQNRIEGSVEYFKKATEDMLLNLSIPTSTGFATRLTNIGEIENSGFELSVNSRNITNRNLQWSTSINFTTLENKVNSLGGISEIALSEGDLGEGFSGFAGQIAIIRPGEALNSFYGWEVEGIWQEGDDFSVTTDNVFPGSIKYKDQNGDGTVNADDRVIMGDSFPDIQWSLGNTLSYRGFEFYVFLEAAHGFEMLNANKMETFYPINFRRNKFAEPFLNRWTPENPSNEYPSFVNPLSQGRKSVNSYTVEDASYIKFRTIRLSYTLPSIFQSLRSAQVYLVGENLYTITDYSGIDPAINPSGTANFGVDRNAFPSARKFILGLRLGF